MRGTDAAALISFATTAYRTEALVGDTVESVLAQSDPDWQLVVVDNGHEDSMVEALRPYLDDPRIVLVRQENRGYVGGLEAAVAACTGDYVVPLDSDDQVLPQFVARVRELLTQHPGVDAVAVDAEVFDEAGTAGAGRGYLRSVGVRPPGPEGEWLTRQDLFSSRVPYYGGAIRRTSWQEVGGYVQSVEGTDEVIDFWLRLVDHGRVLLVPDQLGRYRLRSESVTRDPASVEAFEEMLINTYVVHAEGASAAEQDAARRTVRQLRYLRSLRRARAAFSAGDVTAARRHAREATTHRRTVRSVAVAVLLQVMPWLLLRLHPVKAAVTSWWSHRQPATVRVPPSTAGPDGRPTSPS